MGKSIAAFKLCGQQTCCRQSALNCEGSDPLHGHTVDTLCVPLHWQWQLAQL